jgi:hypothetical protein
MIERILLNTLDKHGITVIPTEEEPLSGSYEVVKEVDGQEKDVGKIAGIVRQGYRLNGKVIRPVQVPPAEERLLMDLGQCIQDKGCRFGSVIDCACVILGHS